MTMKNNTQEESVSTLLGWADEDVNRRGLLIIAGREDGIRLAYHGLERTLVKALAAAMRKDDIVRQVCAKAMILLEEYEASVTNKQDHDTARTK